MNSKSKKLLIPLVVSPGSLICCLYTLSSRNKFLKKKLKKDIYLYINRRKDYVSADLEQFDELYKLLNSLSLRRFAYRLIKPLPLVDKSNVQDICDETVLLKKYLRKFKYNYRLYFFYKSGNHELLPTDKEVNMLAIKSLFFLVGI